jgi:hypothetical protein
MKEGIAMEGGDEIGQQVALQPGVHCEMFSVQPMLIFVPLR